MSVVSEVIVIGAGMAGLAAACRLQQQGRQVIVLDARDRLGGRTWSVKQGGTTLELGASWIHGRKDNPLVALANTINTPISKDTDWESISAYYHDGARIDDPAGIFDRWEQVINKHYDWFKANQPDATVEALVERAEQAGELDFLTPEHNRALVHNAFELDWSADAGDLSLQVWEDGGEYLGGEPMLVNGFVSLIDYMAKDLDIRLEKPVSVVDYRGDEVLLTVNGCIYQARQVVVTVPLGVLQAGDIQFMPALPENKLQAFSAIGMGLMNKIWLEFPSVFWDDSDVIAVAGKEQGRFGEWINFANESGRPILLTFVAGQYAESLESCTDTVILEQALNVLRGIYGDKVTAPVSACITRWRQDSYAKGAYSYLRPGGRSEHRGILAESVVSKVFFAGEATAMDFPATAHGAYSSGIREAKKIEALYLDKC